jgi:hypothetical protein
MRTSFVQWTLWLAVAALGGAAASCDGDGAAGPGQLGGECGVDDDCVEGECCTNKNCGGGMCTFSCKKDGDCPEDMRCEHDFCYFACERDEDCAAGQSCEHGETICEFEKDA